MFTLAYCISNISVWWMTGCVQCFGKHEVCIWLLCTHNCDIDDNCGRWQRACYAKRSCHGRRNYLKYCWQCVCLQSVVSKPGSAIMHCVKSVIGNCRSNVVQLERQNVPKCSVQLGRSGPHLFSTSSSFMTAPIPCSR